MPFDIPGDELWDFVDGDNPGTMYSNCVNVGDSNNPLRWSCPFSGNSWESNIILELYKDSDWCGEYLMIGNLSKIDIDFRLTVKKPLVEASSCVDRTVCKPTPSPMYGQANPTPECDTACISVYSLFQNQEVNNVNGTNYFIVDSLLREDKRHEEYIVMGKDFQFNQTTATKFSRTDFFPETPYFEAGRFLHATFPMKPEWVKKLVENGEMEFIMRVAVLLKHQWETRYLFFPIFINKRVSYYYYRDIKVKVKYDPNSVVCAYTPTEIPPATPTYTFSKTPTITPIYATYTDTPTRTPSQIIASDTPTETPFQIIASDTPTTEIPTNTQTPGVVVIDTQTINADPEFLSTKLLGIQYSFNGPEPDQSDYDFEILSDQISNDVMMTGEPTDISINKETREIFFRPQATGSRELGTSVKSVGLRYRINYRLNNQIMNFFIIEQDEVNRARQEYQWFKESVVSTLSVPGRSAFSGINQTLHSLDMGSTRHNYNASDYYSGTLQTMHNLLVANLPDIHYTCSWRAPYKNRSVGSGWTSKHLFAKAFDIYTNGTTRPTPAQFKNAWQHVNLNGYRCILEDGGRVIFLRDTNVQRQL